MAELPTLLIVQNLVHDGAHAGGSVANHKVLDWFARWGQDVAARGGGVSHELEAYVDNLRLP